MTALALAALFLAPALLRADDYFAPLAVGQRREFAVEVEFPDRQRVRGQLVREIVGKKEIGGKTWFKQVSTYTGFPPDFLKDSTLFRRRAADGVYAFRDDDPARKEFLDDPTPLKAGQKWTIDYLKEKVAFRVEGFETVTVGGKKYEKCAKIHMESLDNGNEGHCYIAPGRGTVLQEVQRGDAKIKMTLEVFREGK